MTFQHRHLFTPMEQPASQFKTKRGIARLKAACRNTADGLAWAIAGLWSEWAEPETGELLPSYTMPTINADDHALMSRMHRPDPALPPDAQDKRSVVPIAPADWQVWLAGDTATAQALLKLPSPDDYDAGPAP